MEPWFDKLAKRAARATPSRRDAFGVAALAAVLGAQRPASAQPAPGAACTIRHLNGSVIRQHSVSHEGLTLQQETTLDRQSRGASTTLTISGPQGLIATIDVRVAPGGAVNGTVNYGRGVAGISSATMTSRDGRSYEGVIDGRPFSSPARARSMSELRFADGRPAPQVVSNPALAASVKGLAARMRQGPGACQVIPSVGPRPNFTQPAPSRPASRIGGAVFPVRPSEVRGAPMAAGQRSITLQGRAPIRLPNGAAAAQVRPQGQSVRSDSRDLAPAGGWYVPGSHDAPSCTACGGNCSNDYRDCWSDAAVDLFCPPCIVPAVAVCVAILAACGIACYVPGNGCCPVQCGGLLDNCCADGSSCIPGHNLCCPAGRAVCNGACCDEGVDSCGPDGLCGCPGGYPVCGDQCCGKGETCCGDQCCPAGKTCCGGGCCTPGYCRNGECCDPPNHMCGTTCCAPLNSCCNGVCCAGSCINGQCCPQGKVCGRVCCGPTQNCLDPNNSVCGVHQCGRLAPCRNMVNGQFVITCCPYGVNCCNGGCCAPGMQCCSTGRGDAVCRATCVN